MTTIRGLPLALSGLLAVGLVLAGLSVEAFTRAETTRAQRALRGALARTVVAEDAPPGTLEAVADARRHVRRRQFERAASGLDGLLAESPTPEVHALAALAFQASDRGHLAARHAQLAARLLPDDPGFAATAERAVDVALAYRARAWTRVAGAAGVGVLLLLATGWLRRRAAQRRLERFLDSVSARLAFTVDGEPMGSRPVLAPDTDTLTLDVFLRGRLGMACPRRPACAPTLHVSFSHAGTSRTVRLTPVRRTRDSAIRIPIRAETLRTLLAAPGRWRTHARLGPRTVAAAPVEVLPVRARTSTRVREVSRL